MSTKSTIVETERALHVRIFLFSPFLGQKTEGYLSEKTSKNVFEMSVNGEITVRIRQ